MKRYISETFKKDLVAGELAEVLKIIKQDDTLMLELRGKSVTVYYRGGKLLEIKETEPHTYSFIEGDEKYLMGKSSVSLENIYSAGRYNTVTLESYIATFKYRMDNYFGGLRNNEKREKRFSIENEIRQHIVRENNYTETADQTDYFIIDTEYGTPNGKKFDIVALEWIADSSKRKLQKGYKPRLAVFELKYTEKAISGECGLCEHLKDFEDFIADKARVEDFKLEMLKVLEQKSEMQLIPYLRFKNENRVSAVAEEIEFINIIANYKHESTKLSTEIKKMKHFKMMKSNFMGYGLFKRNILDKEQVWNLLDADNRS